jgi:hypothetical protein
MHDIIDRYGHHGRMIPIVTHVSGLLALTDAIKGKGPDHDTFYRTVSKYPHPQDFLLLLLLNDTCNVL